MKKIFTLIVVLVATASMMAQSQDAMKVANVMVSDNVSYEKEYTGEFTVTIDKDYTTTGTHKVRSYVEGEVQKLDVTIPSYDLTGTPVGDLTIGAYTICGLTYNESKGGFYRDYKDDGLTMHFTAPLMRIDKDYEFTFGEVLVVIDGSNISITNGFKPGSMPFLITTKCTFTSQEIKGDVNSDGTVDISDVNAVISVICGEGTNDKGDVNSDGTVDISDVNAVIEIICGK